MGDRDGKNVGGSNIAVCRILKPGTNPGEVAQASAVSDVFLGVTLEAIIPQRAASYQKEGRAIVEAGAAVAAHTKITTDGSGRAITSGAPTTDTLLGISMTAASAAGDLIEVELRL
jgi:hypothetical protein